MISLVVPVFNVESYLSRSINSFLGQTFKDIEIILVDDGSTDNSGKICDEYALQDNRIRVFHTNNNGVALARNVGLRAALGNYIIFPDGDDVLHPKMIEILFKMINSGDYDFSMCYGERIYAIDEINNRCVKDFDTCSSKELSRDSCMKDLYLGSKLDEIQFKVVWNKLYKKELLENLYFINTASQDTEFNNRVYQRVRKAILLQDYMYYWIQRSNSITHSGYNLRYVNVIYSFLDCLNGIPKEETLYRSYCLRRMYRIMASHRYMSKGYKSHDVAVQHCKNLLKQTFNEFIKNLFIPLSERVFLSLFNYCPFSYSIFVQFSEYKSKLNKRLGVH